MTICAVKWCHNTSGKHKKCFNITFHRIPTDPIIADKWIKNIRLSRNEEYWKPSKHTRICSNHFNTEDKYFSQGGLCKLRRNAVPIMNLHIACMVNHPVCQNYTEISKINETSSSHELSNLNADQETEEIVDETSNINVLLENSPLPSSDDESLYDTPREAFLRKKLKKSTLLNLKHRKTIKTLRQKLRRLQNKNKLPRLQKQNKSNSSELQKKDSIDNDVSNALSENIYVELFNNMAKEVSEQEKSNVQI